MAKADDKVKFEEEDKPEKYTYFEELHETVRMLKEQVDEHATIMRENNLVREETICAPYFDEDELYDRLESY